MAARYRAAPVSMYSKIEPSGWRAMRRVPFGAGELQVAEGETGDLGGVGQLPVERDRRIEVGHEHASQDAVDIGHAQFEPGHGDAYAPGGRGAFPR
jgi:hypothetical protein